MSPKILLKTTAYQGVERRTMSLLPQNLKMIEEHLREIGRNQIVSDIRQTCNSCKVL